MKKKPPLRRLKADFLTLAQALDDPARVQLFLQLAQKPQNVEKLAERASLSRPTISYHLAVLLRAGLLTMERRGRESIYRADIKAARTLLMELNAGLGAFPA